MIVVTKHPSVEQWHSEMVALLPRLRRFALSLSGTVEDAEDLLQATVEKALKNADKFEPGTDLDKWMFRICKNLWLDEWRARKRRGPSVDVTSYGAEPWIDGEESANNKILVEELKTVLGSMSTEHREVLELVVIEGYAYKEVADMVDVPIGTVMSRLARARQKLASLTARKKRHNNVVSIAATDTKPENRNEE